MSQRSQDDPQTNPAADPNATAPGVPNSDRQVASNATETNPLIAALATPSQHRTDCLACLMAGLQEIGIAPTAGAAVDFGAINSDELCIVLAHSIELCLSIKGYDVDPLSTGFVQLRAAGSVVTLDDFVSALVTLSHPRP